MTLHSMNPNFQGFDKSKMVESIVELNFGEQIQLIRPTGG